MLDVICYHENNLPPEYLDLSTKDMIEITFSKLLPHSLCQIWIKWDDVLEVWSVCIWDPSNNHVMVYAAAIGSDDDHLIFERCTPPHQAYYSQVRMDLPSY